MLASKVILMKKYFFYDTTHEYEAMVILIHFVDTDGQLCFSIPKIKKKKKNFYLTNK